MKSSRMPLNSITPTYAVVIPWRSVPPPAYYPTQTEHHDQITDHQIKTSNQSSAAKRYWPLVFIGGFSMVMLLCASVAVPLIISLKSFSDQTVASETSITSTISTGTISNTSSTSSTGTTTSTTMAPLRWNTTGITVAGKINLTNATSDYLNTPTGITLDSFDSLYVADTLNERVQKFSSGNTTGTTVCGQPNGSVGSTPTRLNYPYDVAVDINGNMYVVDTTNNRVQLWRANASSGITIAGNGTAGNSTTQLDSPRCIAFDSNPGIFYISEANNHRVMRFTLNSTVGTLVAGGNGPGVNTTQLYSPRGLYFDSSTNSLLIANPSANNVVRWVIGASTWTIVAGNLNGALGSGPIGLNNPWDVILDPMGHIYVADRNNDRIQFYLADGTNGTTILGVSGVPGISSTNFNQPLSLALDSQLNLYVSDTANNRIQKFIRY